MWLVSGGACNEGARAGFGGGYGGVGLEAGSGGRGGGCEGDLRVSPHPTPSAIFFGGVAVFFLSFLFGGWGHDYDRLGRSGAKEKDI